VLASSRWVLGPSWPSSLVTSDGWNPCMNCGVARIVSLLLITSKFLKFYMEHMRVQRNIAGYEPNLSGYEPNIVGKDGTYVRSW